MNGQMPYFRFYAAEWLSKIEPLSRDGKVLALVAAAYGWVLSKSGRCTKTISEWAHACGCAEIDVLVGAAELERQPWAKIASNEKVLTIHLPDMDEQAELVTYERDKSRTRRERERGLTPGHVYRGREVVGSEGGWPAPAPTKPAGPAEDAARHAILRDALGRLG